MEQLPEVAGDVLTCSISEFEHRCRVLIAEEQESLAPNTHLVSALCDAVRLSREYWQSQTVEIQAKALEEAAAEWEIWTASTLRDRARLLREAKQCA